MPSCGRCPCCHSLYPPPGAEQATLCFKFAAISDFGTGMSFRVGPKPPVLHFGSWSNHRCLAQGLPELRVPTFLVLWGLWLAAPQQQSSFFQESRMSFPQRSHPPCEPLALQASEPENFCAGVQLRGFMKYRLSFWQPNLV